MRHSPATSLKHGVDSRWMKSSWLSFDNISSVFWFVSGINSVDRMPVNMKNAKISNLHPVSQ